MASDADTELSSPCKQMPEGLGYPSSMPMVPSVSKSTPAPNIPGRPVKPQFHKVHTFEDILQIRVRDKDKMIKLPERYKYLPEHIGAIRATALAGTQDLPTTTLLTPGLPPPGGTPGPAGPPGGAVQKDLAQWCPPARLW